MSDDFEKVTRYKCKWCGKLFVTQNHRCKFSPERRNCMSCQHCIGFSREKEEYGRLHGWFECDLGDETSGYNDLDSMYMMNWDGTGCDHYDLITGYTGSKSYGRHINGEESQRKLREKYHTTPKEADWRF